MNERELRLGNYYDQFGNIHQVNGNVISELEKAPEGQLWCKPIPLTEEWLMKMGFVFVNDNKRYGWYLEVSNNRCLFWCHSKEIQLEFIKDEIEYNNTLFDFKCEHVHTLQNIFYCLCGEELTIKN
jgi:hypothetical protein